MADPRWLDETQQQAWRGLLVFINRGLPQLERTLKDHNLLVVHYSILTTLSETPEHTMGLSELANAANLSQSRLTHRLKTLISSGDVVIEPDPIDGRAKNATLTDVGFRRIESVAPLHAEDVQRLVFDHLDPEETRIFAAGLAKIASSLCAHEQIPNLQASDRSTRQAALAEPGASRQPKSNRS